MDIDTPDTPAPQNLIPEDEKEQSVDTTADDSSDNGKGKGVSKKAEDKPPSHPKSKSHRPHHLKIPKALQRSFSAQSNGSQQAKCKYQSDAFESCANNISE